MNAYNRVRSAMRTLPVLALAALGSAAHAGESDIKLPTFGPQEWTLLWVVLAAAFVSLAFGMWLRVTTLKKKPGTASMVEVSDAVRSGAYAYLRQQIKMMAPFIIIIAVCLILMYKPVYTDPMLYCGVGIAFVVGVIFSYLAGVVGMDMAVKANVRTANQAIKSFKGALETAFQAGAVSGMFTVGMGLFGAIVIFMIFKQDAMKVLVGFGFGGSLAALFMRVGGGIFTKAADVGADLVGKVESGIPEDDPRNPATIADNVGDNVGDCAGMAADVFESYEVTLVAAIILGAACAGLFGPESNGVLKLIIYTLLVRVVGVVASIFGILAVRGSEDDKQDPMVPINRGFLLSWVIAFLGFAVVSYAYMNDIQLKNGVTVEWWRFFLANSAGLLLAGVIDKLTEYFTSTECKPVKDIAASSQTGAATMIISGFAAGLESSVWSVLAICGALLLPLFIFPPALFLGANLSFYGIALTGLGLLSTTGFILAMDTFGPISDNAQGIFEMSDASEQSKDGRGARIVGRLDAVGNTTKALTKGFAIATAVIAAVSLFHSFVADARLEQGKALPVDVPEIFIGLLIGGAAPFLFSSFTIQAVGRAATELILEVRRQFREKPGIMTFKEKPDYAACVAIVTSAAQKELLGPGIIAISLPIIVGFGMGYGDPMKGAQALGGYLVGAIVAGQLMAVVLSNAGGAWDNSKKLIEDGNYGGKGSENHKAAVVCDTVGDPFKDTAGPALNPLIKVMNLVGVLIAPIVIMEIDVTFRTTIVAIAVAAFVLACWWSKRDGKSSKA